MKPFHTKTHFTYHIVFLSVATMDFTEQSKNQYVAFIFDKEMAVKGIRTEKSKREEQ